LLLSGLKLVAIAFALVAAGFAAPACAETARSCESLAGLDLSKVADKPAHVVSAKEGQVLGRAVCEVNGAVEPKVQFRLRLPIEGWDGRYLETGCGGLCGRITDEVHQVYGCAPFQKVEMAVATTDMGHEGPTPDFGDDPQLRVDFAYRGVHVTAEVAKAIVAAFYGRSAERAYFIGCSDGGREGLMEAQRYPADFDGIAAGAPAFNFQIQNTFYHAWNARSNTGPDGKPIIVAADLPVLHRAALKACHAEDGVIADPRRCAFDPVAALCATGQDADCLTLEQVEAARKIYEGPRTADGVWLTVGGPQPGSELSWAGVFVPKPGSDDIFGRVIAGGTISHIAFDPNPPKTFGLNDLGFDRETFERLKPMHALYDATNPDLSAFTAHGGRLILWHGWSDPHISPLNSIAYYRAVRATLGAEAADQALRLFLIPGLYHCEGGEGFTKTDILAPLMAWVEEGKAPDELVLAGDSGTRPVFPYPAVAEYDGKGDRESAASWRPVVPGTEPALRPWIGEAFLAAEKK
jgi:Tannase and feruloyl esterase